MKRQESMPIQAFRIGLKIKGGTNIPSHWERLSHEPEKMVVKSKYRIVLRNAVCSFSALV